jgi:predicted lipoprotein with Yx(FWY)xxD motif
MNMAANSAARRSGLAAALLAGMLLTGLLLRTHHAALAVTSSARPAPPIPVAKVTGIRTAALRADHTKAGIMVADGQGFLLYAYNRDRSKPAASACFSQCAVDWPPVLAAGGTLRLSGISPAQIGILRRADGIRQLTLDGRPLYRYRGDAVPGVGAGNGINATWYLISPGGIPAITPAHITLPPNDPAMGNLEEGDDQQ